MKRLFDVVSGCLVLLLLTPFIFFIWMAIRLDSSGSAFFLQTRIGKHQKPFKIYKFRTMFSRDPKTIDQYTEQVISVGRDPRITRVGRLLRASSLDELPQLLNIIKGDMSLVGPRPIIPEQLEVVPPELLSRFDVRPGLTGLAQVRGRRGLGWITQLKADNEYVKKCNFLYDLVIIFKTVWVVLAGSGVYGAEEQNWRAYRETLKEKEKENE